MEIILIVAGTIISIVGIAAIAIVSGVYIAVKYFGAHITFGTIDEDEND